MDNGLRVRGSRRAGFSTAMAKFVGDICLTIPETRFLLGLAIE
jgi:hypothetical protein